VVGAGEDGVTEAGIGRVAEGVEGGDGGLGHFVERGGISRSVVEKDVDEDSVGSRLGRF